MRTVKSICGGGDGGGSGILLESSGSDIFFRECIRPFIPLKRFLLLFLKWRLANAH